ncbi:unnamed protein product [Ectocarpus sp. 12 AP-2014]
MPEAGVVIDVFPKTACPGAEVGLIHAVLAILAHSTCAIAPKGAKTPMGAFTLASDHQC